MVTNKSISCVVITNGLNNRFLIERTLSSILTTTDTIGWDVEIIVVDNSPEQNIKTILINEGYNNVISKRIKIINSLPNHLPKAFNLGVKTATKKYIALFHDDCEILENRWVEKLTSELNDDIYAVSPEKYTNSEGSFLKEVPLVMERKNFLDIGGYDETYYFGYENKVFCKEIKNNGKIPQSK